MTVLVALTLLASSLYIMLLSARLFALASPLPIIPDNIIISILAFFDGALLFWLDLKSLKVQSPPSLQ